MTHSSAEDGRAAKSLLERISKALSARLGAGSPTPEGPSATSEASMLDAVLELVSSTLPDGPEPARSEAALLALSRMLAGRLAEKSGNFAHSAFSENGFHLLRKHYYCAVPDEADDTPGYWTTPSAMVGCDMQVEAQRAFIRNVLPRHMETFRKNYPIEQPAVHGDFFLLNGSYMAVDAHVYHAMIREYRPNRIVEIGTGYSTILAADIARRMREAGETPPHITAIDPYPWDVFKNGVAKVDEVVAEKVQSVPMERFTALQSGDFLFIDSTHVLRANSDVLYEFLEILPRLNPGVFVHIHDISLPLPYPRVYFDTQTYWNEQWLLQAFLAFNARFKVIWAGNYMMVHDRGLMLDAFPEFNAMRAKWTSSEPTAFWIRST